MNIPFLSLKDVTALHGDEINEAVARVVNGGWYLQGKENEKFEQHYAEFIGIGKALLLNKDLGKLLKEGKGDKIELEFDGNHPEKYNIPKFLWDMCCQNTGWLPKVKK